MTVTISAFDTEKGEGAESERFYPLIAILFLGFYPGIITVMLRILCS